MKPTPSPSRHSIFWAVILCYFCPFVGLLIYTSAVLHIQKNWQQMSAELLISAAGTLLLFWLMARWESAWTQQIAQDTPEQLKKAPDAPVKTPEPALPLSNDHDNKAELENSLSESLKINDKLRADLSSLNEELHKTCLEKESAQQNAHSILSELDSYKHSATDQLDMHKSYIDDLQKSLLEQKTSLDKKQQQIGLLESKVGDLTYEIKTLLQLAEKHNDSLDTSGEDSESAPRNLPPPTYAGEILDAHTERQVVCHEDAAIELKRCLDIAQKITGSHRFNTQMASFLDSPADNFALDLRRLCDSLRNENNSAIVLYSPKENEPLFANNQIKTLTGWSPDKFTQNFEEILRLGKNEWKQAMFSLAMKNHTTVKLTLKTKTGHDIMVNGHLGLIPTGIFRNHAIAVLYPES
jgi:hypothetical protein